MKRIYLDYAATTPVDRRVEVAMKPYWRGNFGNPGSLHYEGQRASRAVFLARKAIAGVLGLDAAKGYRHIFFTGSATEANNLVIRGVLKAWRSASVERVRPKIIISAIEHESILETARDVERGAEVAILPVSRDGVVDVKRLQSMLDDRTILVSVMYANNEVGTIQPIEQIGSAVEAFKVHGTASGAGRLGVYPLLHTDAAQAFQYLDCAPERLHIDCMTLSAHKIYGPKGIGALYVRTVPVLGSVFAPIITGGGQESGVRSATENVPSIVGFAKAAEINAGCMKREGKRVANLRDYFLRRFETFGDFVIVNGARERRLPNNINVFLAHPRAEDLLIKLDLAGIAASVGSACAARQSAPSHVLMAMGADEKRARGSVRFTLGRETMKRDIDKALSVIRKIVSAKKL